jgi:hypothetical protein
MSLNRLSYDACAYNQTLSQSVSPLEYVLDPIKYENCQKCRMELGIVGGTAISHISGNLVDLENDLRNQNRPNTHCADYKYAPPTGNTIQGKEYIKPVEHPVVDTRMKHLLPCQMISYGSVPAEPQMNLYKCGS